MMPLMLCKLAGLITAMLLMAGEGRADLWKCTQRDGSVLFRDGRGPGCQQVGTLPELQSTRLPIASGRAEDNPAQSAAQEVSTPPKAVTQPVSSRLFSPVSRTIPSLYYNSLSSAAQGRGWSLAQKGDIAIVQIDVSYLPAGNGPLVTTDHHFLGEMRSAFAAAVLASAKAVRYDPRYLRAQMTMPTGSILHARDKVDGPSAGIAFAVAVTSALLGDPLRTDICMSGTIEPDLRVGRVGALEHKIDGCHRLPNFQELLVPAGQSTFALTEKGVARSIKVTEVATLAEAYEITTGQSLRPAQ